MDRCPVSRPNQRLLNRSFWLFREIQRQAMPPKDLQQRQSTMMWDLGTPVRIVRYCFGVWLFTIFKATIETYFPTDNIIL
jgi:hypothetical protein